MKEENKLEMVIDFSNQNLGVVYPSSKDGNFKEFETAKKSYKKSKSKIDILLKKEVKDKAIGSEIIIELKDFIIHKLSFELISIDNDKCNLKLLKVD